MVTEYLIRYCELIFSEKMPVYNSQQQQSPKPNGSSSSRPAAAVADLDVISGTKKQQQQQLRPKSLAISTPTKLLSLEEARWHDAL